MRNLLVTGGAGFVGSNFVRYWLREHPADRLVVLDALTYAGNRANLDGVDSLLRFVHGDICDTGLVASLLRGERLDTIVHFAAESHVDRSIAHPDRFIMTNVVGTHSLLKAARAVWLDERVVPRHRFHCVSTDEVYGSLGPSDPPFTETTPYAPNSPYAASKAAADHLVRSYTRTYGLDATISCAPNNYGPYQFAEKLVPLTIVNVLRGRPIPIYGDGRNVREWLHVEDHCRGIEAVLMRGSSGEVYHIGGGESLSNLAIVEWICALADQACEAGRLPKETFPNAPRQHGARAASLITHVEDRPGHDRRYALAAGKAMERLGYRPLHSFDAGIRRTFDWYLEHGEWWRRPDEESSSPWRSGPRAEIET